MRFGIGGYAVIEHGGDELSDWEHIKAVLPTRRAAVAYARRAVGAFSLGDALKQTRHWNETHPHPLNQRRKHQWASLHAFSPGLVARYRQVPQTVRAGLAASIIDEHAQHPHYRARGLRVFCTEQESADYDDRPQRRRAAIPGLDFS